MAITMKDVALHAGVSKSTVSQYVNGNFEYMSKATKKRIQDSIATLNYQPNKVARSLKQKKTNLVAILTATLSSRFTTELIAQIEKYFSENNIDILVASTDDNSQKEAKYIDSLVSRQVDGIIVFPTIENKEKYLALKSQKYPLVFVDRKLPDIEEDTVLLDNQLAAEIAVNELIQNGHNKIGILTFPLGTEDSITTRVERLNGYKKALAEKNIQLKKEYIKSGTTENMSKLLDEMMNLPTPPTAVIATNDVLLEILLEWMHTNNWLVYDDLSVIGIDDVSFAKSYRPPITTIKQPVSIMGKIAAEILLAKINHSEIKYPVKLLEPTLIQRSSVKNMS